VSTDHENRSAKQPCFYFQQHGNCRFGERCHFGHYPADVHVDIKPNGKGFGKGLGKGKGKIGKGGKDFFWEAYLPIKTP
jgi:hypothetical protein